MPLFFEDRELSPEDLNASGVISMSALQQRSRDFTHLPCKNLSVEDKVLYINQREYATVNSRDNMIKFIGSEDSTTCHIVVMKARSAISVGHFDGAGTENGLLCMVEQIQNQSINPQNSEVENGSVIELHIFGGFFDDRGISEELLAEILVALHSIPVNFSIKTACVHAVNNRVRSYKNIPVICGVAANIGNGEIFPATFAYKGPCEVIRHARVYGGSDDMVDIFDRTCNKLIFQPFFYRVPYHIHYLLTLNDNEILQNLSTSPHCEPENFVSMTRKTLRFLLENPDPRTVFRNWLPLVFEMDETGLWK